MWISTIQYIGLRPGEKLHEELITEGEGIVPTDHDKILVLKGMQCDLDIINGRIHELASVARDQDAHKILLKLQEIVPEYRPAILNIEASAPLNGTSEKQSNLADKLSQVR